MDEMPKPQDPRLLPKASEPYSPGKAREILQSCLLDAITAMRDVLYDYEAKPSEKLAAAKAIIDLAAGTKVKDFSISEKSTSVVDQLGDIVDQLRG